MTMLKVLENDKKNTPCLKDMFFTCSSCLEKKPLLEKANSCISMFGNEKAPVCKWCSNRFSESTPEDEYWLSIVSNDGDVKEQLSALVNVKDKTLLKGVVRNGKVWKLRVEAAWRLASQESLGNVILNSEDKRMRRKALDFITDKNVLADVFEKFKMNVSFGLTSSYGSELLEKIEKRLVS